MQDSVILIGYSGHAFVVADCLLGGGFHLEYYCEQVEKTVNPYKLRFLGSETQNIPLLQKNKAFVAIGANGIRSRIMTSLAGQHVAFANAIAASASISVFATLGEGILVASGAVINSMANIGTGAICNSGAIIEHECRLGNYVHVAPGAVLCGNVSVGDHAFVGANAVIRQGLTIGEHAIIGAGAVVVADVPAHAKVMGNPAKIINVN